MALPAFFSAAPRIVLRDPLAELLGAAEGGLIEYGYADAVRLAGHSCPTVAGAYLMARAALRALYPDAVPERGSVVVTMSMAEEEGTTGVIAQVFTLLTGAAGNNGFHGIGGRHARHGLVGAAYHRGYRGVVPAAHRVHFLGVPVDERLYLAHEHLPHHLDRHRHYHDCAVLLRETSRLRRRASGAGASRQAPESGCGIERKLRKMRSATAECQKECRRAP